MCRTYTYINIMLSRREAESEQSVSRQICSLALLHQWPASACPELPSSLSASLRHQAPRPSPAGPRAACPRSPTLPLFDSTFFSEERIPTTRATSTQNSPVSCSLSSSSLPPNPSVAPEKCLSLMRRHFSVFCPVSPAQHSVHHGFKAESSLVPVSR